MTEGDEIGKALWRVLAEIAEREKKKAIQNDDYEGALIATIFQGFFKEVERSLS